jgi:predicted carbohydrate-binding protein with CBM5 and CBM33 domain
MHGVDDNTASTNNINANIPNAGVNANNNIHISSSPALPNVSNSNNSDFLQKKRKIENMKNNKNNNLSKDLASNVNQMSKNNTIGVKLICDNNNEELKKYFSKTV